MVELPDDATRKGLAFPDSLVFAVYFLSLANVGNAGWRKCSRGAYAARRPIVFEKVVAVCGFLVNETFKYVFHFHFKLMFH